jgi:hypothetical protein
MSERRSPPTEPSSTQRREHGEKVVDEHSFLLAPRRI